MPRKYVLLAFSASALLGGAGCNLILANDDLLLVGPSDASSDASLRDGGGGAGGAGPGNETDGAADATDRDSSGGGGADVLVDGGNQPDVVRDATIDGPRSDGRDGAAGSNGSGGASGAGGVGGGAGAGGASGSGGAGGVAGAAGSGGAGGAGGNAGASGGAGGVVDGGGIVDARADGIVDCKDRVVNDVSGIFVDLAFGNDASVCGSRLAPCATINRAIDQSPGSGRTNIYVAPGTYEEAISLAAIHAGMHIEGAWNVSGSTWTPSCTPTARQLVKLHGSTNGATVRVEDAGDVTIAGITIQSKDVASPGESLYGVFATGANTHLILDNVSIEIVAAGDGATGDPGAPGTASTAGCASADGIDGTVVGSMGTGGVVGTFDASGYVAANGLTGALGEPGNNGAAPTVAPTCVMGGTSCGGTGCTPQNVTEQCGTDGKAGCGGTSGGGGLGGRGGGSSVGLYVWNAKVDVLGGAIASSNGGTGALGGAGGPGAVGAAGVAGSAGPSVIVACYRESEPGAPKVCLVDSYDNGLGGGPGGVGGHGAQGGPGGAGSGGFSIAVFKGGASVNVSLVGSPALKVGVAGTSLGNGQSGAAKTEWP